MIAIDSIKVSGKRETQLSANNLFTSLMSMKILKSICGMITKRYQYYRHR